MDMTNTNYYHHQKQEDETRSTASIIVAKTTNSKSESKIASSPLIGTAPNSAPSSPLTFLHNDDTNSDSSNNRNTMTSSNEQQDHLPELENCYCNSTPHNNNLTSNDTFSRGPLSPQSAPPTTSIFGSAASFPISMAPVPSVIHTEAGLDVDTNVAKNARHGSTPYFPSMNKSASMSSFSGSSNLIAKKSTTKVTGKKKHQTNKPKTGSNTTLAQPTTSPRLHDGGDGATKKTGRKKQRRLERNRLSAQLSRRRRKQYLEELEDRVVQLSLDMDSGRRAHAFQAIDRISEMRNQVLSSAHVVVREIESFAGTSNMDNSNRMMTLKFQLDNFLRLLGNTGPLSRTNSQELLILNSFFGQQLKSFSMPSHSKFILWLSLQGDIYYRGGRAASERLSAARIGERMLANGNDKVAPTNAMWPLVCNEVGLSYELEERLRLYQRTTILQDKSTWLDRHTAHSSALAMQSLHDNVGGMAQMVGNRESAMVKGILTPSQHVKFLTYMRKNSNRIKERLQARRERSLQQQSGEPKIKNTETDANFIDIGTYVDPTYQLNKTHHLAANLYILNHQLLRLLKDFPYRFPSILTPPVLKKLMRRASFESLGQHKDADSRGTSKEDASVSSGSLKSLPSNGSLLKSTSNLSLGVSSATGSNDSERPAQITPQVGEQAAVELVKQALGFVHSIIPPMPKPTNRVQSTLYAPVPVSHSTGVVVPTQETTSSMAIDYHSHHLAPAPVTSYGAPVQLAPAPPFNHQLAPAPQYEAVAVHQYQPTQLHTHNYSVSNSQIHHNNQSYHEHQTENYYPPQQHIHYAPPSTTPAHNQQIISMNHEKIAPLYEASSSAVQQQETIATVRHERKSSFLPASLNSLNVVPEDMFPGVEGTAADFIELQDCLMDGEDWGIGIGLDMDTTT